MLRIGTSSAGGLRQKVARPHQHAGLLSAHVGVDDHTLGVYGEDQGETGDREGPRLIIDRIDCTRYFIRGIPLFGTLLAIEEGGDVVAGLVSAPALGARWHAAQG